MQAYRSAYRFDFKLIVARNDILKLLVCNGFGHDLVGDQKYYMVQFSKFDK